MPVSSERSIRFDLKHGLCYICPDHCLFAEKQCDPFKKFIVFERKIFFIHQSQNRSTEMFQIEKGKKKNW